MMGSGLIMLAILLPDVGEVWRSMDNSPLLDWVMNLGIPVDRVQIWSLQLYVKMTKSSSSDSS